MLNIGTLSTHIIGSIDGQLTTGQQVQQKTAEKTKTYSQFWTQWPVNDDGDDDYTVSRIRMIWKCGHS